MPKSKPDHTRRRLRAPSRGGVIQRQVDHDGAPLTALQRRHVPNRRPGAQPTRVLEEDAHADASRDGARQACAADGRILPDAYGPSLHRADRDALCVSGQERRYVVEAQEEAEEAHGFETQLTEPQTASTLYRFSTTKNSRDAFGAGAACELRGRFGELSFTFGLSALAGHCRSPAQRCRLTLTDPTQLATFARSAINRPVTSEQRLRRYPRAAC
jgi:hypothetical protein